MWEETMRITRKSRIRRSWKEANLRSISKWYLRENSLVDSIIKNETKRNAQKFRKKILKNAVGEKYGRAVQKISRKNKLWGREKRARGRKDTERLEVNAIWRSTISDHGKARN